MSDQSLRSDTRANLLRVRIAPRDAPSPLSINPGSSRLLCGASICNEYDVIWFLAPELNKDASLGRLFSELNPGPEGSFGIEVGAILPDLLPNLDGSDNYCVEIRDESGRINTLCVSNQMVEVRVAESETHRIMTMPLTMLPTMQAANSPHPVDGSIPPRFLRSMVSGRYVIHGTDAEDALEGSIDGIISEFLYSINAFLMANQMLLGTEVYPALPSGYDRAMLDYLYFILWGDDENANRFGRIALNFSKIQLRPVAIEGEQASLLREYLKGSKEIDELVTLLCSAKSALDGGLLRFALLQLVIAAEMATTRYVRKALISKGVSNSRLKSYERDISYGMLLEIYLPALTPTDGKPDEIILTELNNARRYRNTLMHEGKMEIGRDALIHLQESTEIFIKYLTRLEVGLAKIEL